MQFARNFSKSSENGWVAGRETLVLIFRCIIKNLKIYYIQIFKINRSLQYHQKFFFNYIVHCFLFIGKGLENNAEIKKKRGKRKCRDLIGLKSCDRHKKNRDLQKNLKCCEPLQKKLANRKCCELQRKKSCELLGNESI